ncbi:MAG: molybdenum cofactor biosynthesis protein MoaE [Trueperaceae bacterium]
MFAVVREAIDVTRWNRLVEDDSAGAFVFFEGRVRDNAEGRKVQSLAYEVYDVLAEKEGARLLHEALARFPIARAACVHRAGHLSIGDTAVWVGVSGAHRTGAFEACRFIIDELKQRVPIWKKEFYAEGDSGWVDHSAVGARAVRQP